MERRLTRWLIVVAATSLLAAALLGPVGAHINDDEDHAWKHLKGKAKALFYTKKQSDTRFLPGGTLPPGKTMTGTWGVIAKGTGAGWDVQTFPQRLPADVIPWYWIPDTATSLGEEPDPCPGTPQDPKALPGNLCVYESLASNLKPHDPASDSFRFCLFRPEDLSDTCPPATGRTGVGIAVFPDDPAEQFSAEGSWAVTAAKTTPALPTSAGVRSTARSTGAR